MGHASERQIELQERGFGEVTGDVCIEHLLDDVLRAKVEIAEGSCGVCGRVSSNTASLDEVASVVKEAVDWYFGDPIDPPDDVWPDAGPDAYGVVQRMCEGAFEEEHETEIIGRIAGAFVEYLGLSVWPYDQLSYLDWRWYKYTRFVRDTVRFVFNDPRGNAPREVKHLLEELKGYLTHPDTDLVRAVPQGLSLFRGRLVEDTDSVKPRASELGPAPAGRGAANRMSPAGISLFYGSEDAQTAIAEIAGHSPKPVAVVGEFRATRTLHILDLAGTPSPPGSVFDPERREAVVMRAFLRHFVEDVTRPVIPDGREHVEYAPTQVMTEFIRWTSTTIVDGIAFPSSTNPGKKTYVLFVGSDQVADAADEGPDDVLVLPEGAVTVYDVRRSYLGVERRPEA